MDAMDGEAEWIDDSTSRQDSCGRRWEGVVKGDGAVELWRIAAAGRGGGEQNWKWGLLSVAAVVVGEQLWGGNGRGDAAGEKVFDKVG